jgi:hypothetical protein
MYTSVAAGFVSGQSMGSDIIQEEAVSRLSPNPPRGDHSLPDTSHEIIIQVSDADSESNKGKYCCSLQYYTHMFMGSHVHYLLIEL